MPVDKGDDNTEREAVELKISDETEKARKRRVHEAWGIVLSTPQGRAVVWDIINDTGKDTSPARATGDETQRMIGRHDFGRELYDAIRSGYPRRFLEMVQENM